MEIILKGIEIENFKSYVTKQCIDISDLSVLLGANSSGKSTALQALLAMKQTMECNSPDEELLLSGKYVALGDFDDVISDRTKEYFNFAIILEQTGDYESAVEGDCFKISWCFKRGEDRISAVLDQLDITNENLNLSFKRAENGLYHMFIDDERSAFSAKIHNLLFVDYILHYDKDINNKAFELLNVVSKMVMPKKVITSPTDIPVAIEAIDDFYFQLFGKIQEAKADIRNESFKEDVKALASRLQALIDRYGDLVYPGFAAIPRAMSNTVKTMILNMTMPILKNYDNLEKLIIEHEQIISEYEESSKKVEDYSEIYELGANIFNLFNVDDEKKDQYTQIKYALDFYASFYQNIISKIFFVGPIRETPQGLYNIGFETIPKYVGPTGAYFASVLLHENKKERNYILPDGNEICTLSDALAAWMVHLDIASSVYVDKKNSFGFSVSVENMERVKSDIMNVGIGTSQVLPVLISVLLSEPGEILIFEQPELHLHPYSQSRLADMFTEFCRCGRKIILETHSEYFLLRLRYHIVKENYSNEAAAVNFFQNDNGTQVTCANISGFGNIEYPTDFRDETQELLDAILNASLERKGLL